MLDTSDLDRRIGIPITGGDIVEDIHVNDIRRWVQAMQNPNPLHYDRAWAKGSRFGDIVAPLSFTVNTTWGHGPLGSHEVVLAIVTISHGFYVAFLEVGLARILPLF